MTAKDIILNHRVSVANLVEQIYKHDRKATTTQIIAIDAKALTLLQTEINKCLPKKKDMSSFEGIDESGGIDTTVFDAAEDPRGTKNGEMLAHLAQYASDTGYNQGVEDCQEYLREFMKLRKE